MDRQDASTRALATAMLIVGLIVEIVGVWLLLNGRPVAVAVAVLVPGMFMLVAGIVLLAGKA